MKMEAFTNMSSIILKTQLMYSQYGHRLNKVDAVSWKTYSHCMDLTQDSDQ